MTDEKARPRSSNGWYIWAAASAVVLVADVVLHGITSLNIFLAPLSIAFAGIMFSGKRAEDRVIARYQERPPLAGAASTMPLAMRVSLLGLLEKSLWALWFVLLTSSIILPMGGNLNLSRALTEGMIALVLLTGPIRIFTAAALFR